MPSNDHLDKVKKLREITGVGFKDCKIAIDETKGDIEKAIEFLRKKGIAKANKKMQRVAAEGLVSISENENIERYVRFIIVNDYIFILIKTNIYNYFIFLNFIYNENEIQKK